MRTIFLMICFSALPAIAGSTYDFTVSPAENVSGSGGSTLTGWGYTIQNQSSSDWLVTTGLNVGTFQFATPTLIFDFPDVAPGATITVPYSAGTGAGLFQIEWDKNAPAGFVNSGTFTLMAEWWNGDPLAGGSFLANAPDASAPYSATSSATPEPASFALIALPLLVGGALRLRRSGKTGYLGTAR